MSSKTPKKSPQQRKSAKEKETISSPMNTQDTQPEEEVK